LTYRISSFPEIRILDDELPEYMTKLSIFLLNSSPPPFICLIQSYHKQSIDRQTKGSGAAMIASRIKRFMKNEKRKDK